MSDSARPLVSSDEGAGAGEAGTTRELTPARQRVLDVAAEMFRSRGYDRTPRQAHNDLRAPVSRQQFARSGDGSSWNRGTGERYRSGARPPYDRSMQAYRAPASGFQRGEFGGRSSWAFTSSDFSHSAGKPPHSGGFHLFGGGHAPKTVGSRGSGGFHMGGGGHTPKSFHGSGRNFGGGHPHGGGGHSGGHSGGKHHR